ncbi:MAG: BREX-1 system adenine-specific DNA-methyltransferase PglX, partial [Armatimonadota bacterium]|nr:BREX-1 system adenine-specific DNA-methyltransferase PglX [Armatimonadota bacterium]
MASHVFSFPAPQNWGGGDSSDSFAEAVLRLNVCDPAMGSGHFLVEATAFLAERVAAHPTTRPRAQMNPDGTPQTDPASGELVCTEEAKLAYWKRRVVEACIYGVDLNPLAVELAKLSLWLETVDRVPLNFLDHHLRCGNSLLGTPLKALSQPPLLKPSKKQKEGQLSLTFGADLTDAVTRAIADIQAIEGVSTDTHEAAKTKERLWREISQTLMPRFRRVADLWLAPWFGASLDFADFYRMFESGDRADELWQARQDALVPLRPFHWELEFPDIFFDDHGAKKAEPGFDAVIGNPPWERIKLQENEFFAGRSPAIAHAAKASDRKKLIAALPQTDPALWADFRAAADRAERLLAFTHRSGFFPLMGRGDTNLYAVFAERALQLVHPRGRVGLLVPSGIATDDTTKKYFQELVVQSRLAALLDFENKKRVFEDVDSRFKFSIVLVTGESAPQSEARCGFFLHDIADLNDPERVFPLTPDDFQTFNPNTLTCPIFRSKRDAELTRKIYGNVPVLVRHAPSGPLAPNNGGTGSPLAPNNGGTRGESPGAVDDPSPAPQNWGGGASSPAPPLLGAGGASGTSGNPWGVSFLRMFDMTNDSHLFKTQTDLEAEGFYQDADDAGQIYTHGQTKSLPLYEGKMVQMYDHRAASIVVNPANLHRPAQEVP